MRNNAWHRLNDGMFTIRMHFATGKTGEIPTSRQNFGASIPSFYWAVHFWTKGPARRNGTRSCLRSTTWAVCGHCRGVVVAWSPHHWRVEAPSQEEVPSPLQGDSREGSFITANGAGYICRRE